MSALGSANHRWSSDLRSSHGYRKVRVGVGHPLADPKGYAYEHAVVWRSAGRRAPGPGELIHHRNGDKADNRLANLELVERGEHSAEHAKRQPRDAQGRFRRRRRS